jgi:hypothetical protein
MNKIVATYQITVTLRAPDGRNDDPDLPEAPTNSDLEGLLVSELKAEFPFVVHVESQRTDR